MEGLFWAEFSEVRAETDDFIDAKDQVLVTVAMQGRGKAERREDQLALLSGLDAADGTVTRGQGFTTRAEALEAVGLRVSP
jgi:hypothetical protein